MKTFKFYTDPGHGWLAVKRQLLIDLGILEKVTQFSYQSKTGKTVYLEEDLDAGLFLETWAAKHGEKPQTKEQHHYNDGAPIRYYNHFRLTPEEYEREQANAD